MVLNVNANKKPQLKQGKNLKNFKIHKTSSQNLLDFIISGKRLSKFLKIQSYGKILFTIIIFYLFLYCILNSPKEISNFSNKFEL